jgi:tetratricopeptide (TPR) repeat protein
VKQRLEFETELERSSTPDLVTKSTVNTVAAPTVQDRALTTAEKTVTHVSSAEYIVTGIKRNKIAVALVVLLIVAGLSLGYYFYYHRAQPLTERDTVLLTDFVNTTGEPVFDGTLKQALAVQLGQTPFLTLFPEERVRETLRFMGRSPDDRITRDVGREICQRQGIKAMLGGSIARLGNNYVITLEAINPRSNDPFASEQVEADSKEKVLSSLGTAASNLRQKLGESLSSIQKYDVKIEQATTSSLDALKAYAMGDEERTKGRARESLVFYKRAVELDPNFAMAYARIGVHYFNQEQIETSRQYIQKAYDLRDRVSERERLYIAEKYYNYVTGEFEKAVETLQTWSRLYPNDFVPHNNLSLNYKLMGRHEDALRESLEASRLSPNNTTARINVVGGFVSLGRFDEAAQALGELQQINPDILNAHTTAYFLAFIRGDQSAMEREIQWAKGKPEEADFTALQGVHAMYLGKLKASEEFAKRAIDLFKQQNRHENAANVLLSLAGNMAVLGKCEQAKNNASAALSTFRAGEFTVAGASTIYAACNDAGRAQAMLDQISAAAPTNMIVTAIITPTVRALIEKNRGNTAEAIRLLESVRSYDLGQATGLGNNYARGMLYLEQRRANEAAAEFKKIIDSPGVDGFSPFHALAYVGLARASALSGDTSGARKAYQDFFAIWKDADADLPVLVEARKEYEVVSSQ